MKNNQKHIVWVVEDDPLFKESMEELINLSDKLHLELSVSSVEQVEEEKHKVHAPDVILQDIGLPGKSGLEALGFYRNEFPDAKVIILTIFEDDERIYEAIKRGASGYLLKRTPAKQILDGIDQVIMGEASISPLIAKKMMNIMVSGAPVKESNLTTREKDILKLLVDGFSMDMISGELEISTHTVDTHIKNIYRKLEVHNRAEVVSKAIKERLI
ncbi:MAG: response regulator transcription factor [Balneolaceae bacterium]|nr:response regulator transcription factor [Balneolaceae bacterium]MBO6546065.1 response regulator transcription factor [Balneolaceae bacterium]MBO6647461.1 response regulator transcription factor [Balneolaceae bacterium]